MASMLPVAVYGLKVPAGNVMIPALTDFGATFRVTMAAIDPSAPPSKTDAADSTQPVRATLKLVYDPHGHDDESGDSESDDEEATQALMKMLAGQPPGEDDEEDSEEDSEEDEDDEDDKDGEDSNDDEEVNGGPSDHSKTKRARKEAAARQLLENLLAGNDDESEGSEVDQMDIDDAVAKVNGVLEGLPNGKGKGKEKANGPISKAVKAELNDEDDEGDEDDEEHEHELQEVVLCTLDAEKNYQQTLDITVPEDQQAWFKVSGTHAIYLTGNYVVPADDGPQRAMNRFENDNDYDLEPDGDEIDMDELDDDESDELDNIEDPRVTEVTEEDDTEAPALAVIKSDSKKGKNKRPAEASDEEPATTSLDDIMAKSLKPADKAAEPEPKLSKKQLKKLKKNDGQAAPATATATSETKPADAKSTETKSTGAKPVADKEKPEKKVSFAKELEQPGKTDSSPPKAANAGQKRDTVKVVSGVKIDDRKPGKGPVAKKGDHVSMRYIGKLSNGKVFDANKKGAPFRFKLGEGNVIKGWDIGVPGMAVQGERRLVIPANLAYGNKKMPDIPANSELTFDIKLLDIN